jgi:hypothetical protein
MNGDSQSQPDPNQAQSPWQYTQGNSAAAPTPAAPQQYVAPVVTQPDAPSTHPEEVAWTASEFIAHEKTTVWYVRFGAAVIAGAAILFFITHDFFAIVILLLFACLVGFTASRKPREVSYSLNQYGLSVGSKFYAYDDFHSFGVLEEGAFSCIVFDPIKRLGLPVSAYYAPADEARIMDVLMLHLPFEKKERDPIERLSQRIRF